MALPTRVPFPVLSATYIFIVSRECDIRQGSVAAAIIAEMKVRLKSIASMYAPGLHAPFVVLLEVLRLLPTRISRFCSWQTRKGTIPFPHRIYRKKSKRSSFTVFLLDSDLLIIQGFSRCDASSQFPFMNHIMYSPAF